MSRFLIPWALLAASAAAQLPGPWPPRGYSCRQAEGTIEIDGVLDEPDWQLAPWTDDFVDIEGDRRPLPRHRARAKLLWDEQNLYVAASLEEPHLWATLRERDSVIYYDNDFEVFLDPDGDSHLYTEIELNALNTVWDLLLVKPYRDGGPAIHAWDIPGLQTAVHLDGTLNDPSDEDSGWTLEIAIPFAVLRETTTAACPPEVGDRWRLNFSRVQWRLDVVDGGYAKTIDPQSGKSLAEDNWVWSPQRQIAMHEPEHWGILEFQREVTDAPRPSEADAGEWHLRLCSYRLAELRERDGSYPASFTSPQLPSQRPSLGPWSWPPDYWSDGARYTLSMHADDRTLQLDETGRLQLRKAE